MLEQELNIYWKWELASVLYGEGMTMYLPKALGAEFKIFLQERKNGISVFLGHICVILSNSMTLSL